MESRYVDWWGAFKGDEWHCVGRQVMEEKKGSWSEDNPEGLEGDDYIPIYNFAYPLDLSSLDENRTIGELGITENSQLAIMPLDIVGGASG